MIDRLKPKSEFSRNVLTLMTGTTIAQAIPIAITPILTRLYTPEEFGLLALFMSISGVLAAIATMRYELAIMLPRNNEEASDVFWLSIMISGGISLILLFIVMFFGGDISVILGSLEIAAWLYLVPISVFFTGIYQSLNYWNTRAKQFPNVAKSKVLQTTMVSSTQLALGYSVFKGAGLILAATFGQVVSTVYLIGKLRRDSGLKSFRFKGLIAASKKYKKFPLVSAWGALFNKFALQMPIFVITKFFSAGMAGQFSLTYRVLNVPMALIGTSVSQVLFQKIVELHDQQPEKLKVYLLQIFFLLLLPMIPMIVVLFFWGEQIFQVVFGLDWVGAGTIASTLSFAVAIKFAVSPLSMVLAMDHNLKLGTLWQTLYLVTLTLTLLWASQFELEKFVIIFVIHEVILYTIYFTFILKGAENMKENQQGVR